MREILEKQLRAIEEISNGRPEGILGELYDELKAELEAAKRDACYPSKPLHDVPTIEDTPLERTFTGTFIGRLRKRLRKGSSR